MSVSDKDSIDWMIQKKSGEGLLVIVDELDWSDEGRHLLLLQEKLHRYLDFIESGEVYVRFTERGASVSPATRINVEIIGRFDLPDVAQRFLKQVQATFNASNLGLSFRHSPNPVSLPRE